MVFLKKWYNLLLRKSSRQNLSDMVLDVSSIIPEKVQVSVNLPEVRLISTYDNSKPSIVIIDDSKGIVSIVQDYVCECGISSDTHNILSFYGDYAPFVMKQTLEALKEKGLTKIEFAIIDIVLPEKMKVGDKYIKLDGIDVAVYLNGNHSLTNFVFYTGNIISAYVEFINEKTKKFKKHFGKEMIEHVVFKGGATDDVMVEEFCKLIGKEKYQL